MVINLISDLHLEFGSDIQKFKQECDVLVVAGDVAVGPTNVAKALNILADQAEHVVYVAGNHEYYGSTIQQFNETLPRLLKDNVHFLDDSVFTWRDTTFIGSTLWAAFQDDPIAQVGAGRCISDFRRINNFDTGRCKALGKLQEMWLKNTVESLPNGEKKVIVTHFLPAMECISHRFRGPDPINKYFAHDLGNWIETLENTHWMFGHTHDTVCVTIGKTLCRSNPYGYFRHEENPEFI